MLWYSDLLRIASHRIASIFTILAEPAQINEIMYIHTSVCLCGVACVALLLVSRIGKTVCLDEFGDHLSHLVGIVHFVFVLLGCFEQSNYTSPERLIQVLDLCRL